jgi:hypothetical protein
VNLDYVCFKRRLFAEFSDLVSISASAFLICLLDPCRMDAPVDDEPFERDAGDFPAHRIKNRTI